MNAVVVSLRRAGALELGANLRLIFILEAILEGEAEGSGLAHEEESDAGSNVKELDYVDWDA
jgi:hypothetical protein